MTVDHPDEFVLTCDHCSNSVSIDVEEMSDDSNFMVGFVRDDLPEGWEYDLDQDEIFCPNCK